MSAIAWLAAATPVPTPSPGKTLPAYIGNEDLVTPGWIGFTAIFLVAVVVILLVVDMVRRLRRLNYRADVRAKLEAEEQAMAELEAGANSGTPAEPGTPKDSAG